MSKEKIPMKFVVPIIVVTWVLSLISALAVVYLMPTLFPVKSEQISTGLITSDMIADEAIITVKLADGNVTSAKILNGDIAAVDIANNSIITVKVADGNVTTAKIADKNVTTAKIADKNVTTAKIADYAIIEIKLAGDSVTTAKILDATITAADLADGSVWSAEIKDGEVTTLDIRDYAVTDKKLAAGAIPHSGNHSTSLVSTNSALIFEDMPDMSVNMTLTRNSSLLITFSAEVAFTGSGPYALGVTAMVNDTATTVNPWGVWVTSVALLPEVRSYTFYVPNVAAGFYTIKIQWMVADVNGPAWVWDRTLAVIALPA